VTTRRRVAFKYGLTRSRIPVTVTVGWADPPVDVSASVVSGRVSHGSGESNSERSTIAVARGTLVLQGADFQPGRSTRFSEAVLSRRAQCKVMLGTTLLWQGWVERPQAVPRVLVPQTSFDLVGGLEAQSRARVEVSSSTANLYTDATVWADVVGAVPRLVGAAGAGITFAPFMFKGRGFELASLAAMVGGRLAGEDKQGRLTMPTYGRLPQTQTPVTSTTHLIRRAVTGKKVDQIRNRVHFPFETAPTRERLFKDHVFRYTSGMLPGTATATVSLPAAPDNTAYSDYQVSIHAFTASAISSIQTSRNNDNQRFIDSHDTARIDAKKNPTLTPTVDLNNDRVLLTMDLSGLTSGDVFSWRYSINTSFSESTTFPYAWNAANEIKIDRPGTYRSGKYRWGRAQHGWTNPPQGQMGVDDIEIVVRTSWLATTTPQASKTFQNLASQGVWGVRSLDFPLWMADDGLDAGEPNAVRLQADLDDLATARTYHDVALPLWQRDAARSAEIAALDYGDYVDLGIRDDRRGVNIADKCVISERTLTWGAAQVPAVELRCLHTGEAGTPPTPPAVQPPGPPRSLMAAPAQTSIALSWLAPNTGGDPTHYSVQHRLRAGVWGGDQEVTGLTTTITGLTANTEYLFRVASVNTAGSSDWVEGMATTTSTPTPTPTEPGPVRGLAATPGNTTLAVAWQAPTSGGDPTAYRIQWGTGTAGSNRLGNQSLASTARSYEITGLTNSTPYWVRVRASNNAGNGGWETITATPSADTPTQVQDLTLEPGDGEIVVTWTAPSGGDVDGYELEWGTTTAYDTGSLVLAADRTTATISGLTNGTVYLVRIRATSNTEGDGVWSDDRATPAAPSVNPYPPPKNVRLGSAIPSGNAIWLTVAWDRVDGTQIPDGSTHIGYRWRFGGTGNWTNVNRLTAGASSFTRFTRGATWIGEVQARYRDGDSNNQFSDIVRVTGTAGASDDPTVPRVVMVEGVPLTLQGIPIRVEDNL